MKLKTKIITYVSTVLVSLVLAIAIIVFWVIQPDRLEKLMRATMLKVAGSVVYELGLQLQENDSTRFNKLSRRLIRLEDVYGLSVYDLDGRLYFTSQHMTILEPKIEQAIYQQVFQEQQHLFVEEMIDQQNMLSLFYPIIENDRLLGALKLTFTFESLHAYRRESIVASLLACIVGLFILVILVYYLLSNVFSRIRAVITKMNTIIRERDLTQRVHVQSRDEIGELGEVFNRMVEGLLRLTREIQGAGLRVTTSTEKIVETARYQLERAEELMESVDEARRGVEDVKKLSEHISKKAETVLNNAEYTFKKTIRGVEVIEELVTEMNEVDVINKESVRQINALIHKAQQITEIVTMIEDITANTKLIAFNATIEAARAGDAGKGFSVVASEIRSLADSVGVATNNIRKIIRDMQEATTLSAEIEAKEQQKVEHGLLSVRRTKEHLDMVQRMLDDTVKHAREISQATEEQKTSNDTLFKKIQEFFHIAQSTKASSANTSESARSLDRLAEEMQATVERFKLE